MNTYLRKPIKKAFTTNLKKLVIQVQRHQDRVLDHAYPQYRKE